MGCSVGGGRRRRRRQWRNHGTAALFATILVVAFQATGLALAPGGPGLRCWVCGEDATPHDTNPESRQEQIKQTEQLGIAAPALQPNSLKTSWCSSSIHNASCIPDFYGQELSCFKEDWTVDGKKLVKRGCAKKDVRYNKTGCEEQITGSGNFRLVLCLCNENLCNGKIFQRSAAAVAVEGRAARVAILLSLLSSL